MLRTSPCGFQSIPPFISISVVPRVSYYTFHPETHFQFLLTPFDGAHASHHVSFLDIPFSFNAPTRLKDGVTDLLRLCAEADNASLPRKCEGETRPRKCKEKSSFPATLKDEARIRRSLRGAQTRFFLAAHLHTSTQSRCP